MDKTVRDSKKILMDIWFDVTTTIGWKRPVLGIVRVETEMARYLLSTGNQHVRFCRFDYHVRSYYEVSRDEINTALVRLNTDGHTGTKRFHPIGQMLSKPAKVAKSVLGRLRKLLHGAIRRLLSTRIPKLEVSPQPFKNGAIYISLGLDWDQKDMAFLYELKQKFQMKVLLFCYDIIPILLPQYCASGVPEKFRGYIVDAARCADKILCISKCSLKDLSTYLEKIEIPLPSLNVIQLGSDILVEADTPPSSAISEVIAHRFILFVSTIESRKNHDILCRAYRYLHDSGYKNMPVLVFVGMQGWGVDRLMSDLSSDGRLGRFIRVFDHVSDNDLVHLYTHSMFTVYPSFYEGWGLPVAESLAYGKFCLASNAASISEVGGDFIEYLDPFDESAWASRLLWYFEHPEEIEKRQDIVKRCYCQYTWNEMGAVILAEARVL